MTTPTLAAHSGRQSSSRPRAWWRGVWAATLLGLLGPGCLLLEPLDGVRADAAHAGNAGAGAGDGAGGLGTSGAGGLGTSGAGGLGTSGASSGGETTRGGTGGAAVAGTSGNAGARAGGAGGAPAGGSAGNGGAGGASQCGNGNVDAFETCDDRNTTPGDGCGSTCAIESGWVCSGSPSTCTTTGPCNGLAATCGATGSSNCCASTVVPAGSFYRSYDGVSVNYTSQAYPATVSAFRLDTYEITVGRFRKFVTAYTPNMIARGAGKNPSNPGDPGWDTAWNANLPANAATLTAALKCGAVEYQSWTDSPGTGAIESRPVNCVNWYEAEAFCIWDGGRLPTEAEWNYAAAGGAAQRAYPWSNPPTSTTIQPTNAVYEASAVQAVGSKSPQGDGAFGQADLGGNVWEWVEDWYDPYSASCANCAQLSPTTWRVNRGGGFSSGAANVLSSFRTEQPPDTRGGTIGARCARAP